MHCTFHRVQSNALEVLPLQSVKMNFSLKLFNFFLLEVIITSQFHYNVFTSSLNSIYSDYIGPLNYVFKDSKESVASASKSEIRQDSAEVFNYKSKEHHVLSFTIYQYCFLTYMSCWQKKASKTLLSKQKADIHVSWSCLWYQYTMHLK